MKRFFIFTFALIALYADAFACTSAIVAPQRSSEGVPLLWKHRDSKMGRTRVAHFRGERYSYTALVPNNKRSYRSVFGGINEVGFATISTATGHLPVATPEEYAACKREVARALMYLGLGSCATVDDFEEMLRTTKRARGFDSNIGVADGTGAVAYFEIWDLGYRRYDADKREEGFDVRANFSHAGDPTKKGASKRRYDLIMREMNKHNGNFSPQDFIGYSRSYDTYQRGDLLANNDIYVCDNYAVPRASTVATMVMVCDKDNPRMLISNGHSVSSLAVPVYVHAKHNIPRCVKGHAMRLLSDEFKAKAYREIGNGLRILQKDVVRKVLKIKQPKIQMPQQMPDDMVAFNAKIDELFAKHEKRVRKVLAKF